jgi:hypothetical protein
MYTIANKVEQGFLKYKKTCNHFLKIFTKPVLISKPGCQGNSGKIGYSIQGLVAKVKDTVRKWLT